MPKIFRCRHCGSTRVASLDRYVGSCAGDLVVGEGGKPEFDPGGYTVIQWDSCVQEGWQCCDCLHIEDASDDGLEAALDRLVRS